MGRYPSFKGHVPHMGEGSLIWRVLRLLVLLLGWRYCDVILIFWYHNQEFSGHNDTKMTLQTEDDDGSGRIREKWFGNHFVWDDGLMVHMHSLIHALLFKKMSQNYPSVIQKINALSFWFKLFPPYFWFDPGWLWHVKKFVSHRKFLWSGPRRHLY